MLAGNFSFSNREVHGKGATVFSLADNFSIKANNFCGASGYKVVDIAIVLDRTGWRHEHVYVFSNDLTVTVAKYFFGGGIIRFNQTPSVNSDNAVYGAIDNGLGTGFDIAVLLFLF